MTCFPYLSVLFDFLDKSYGRCRSASSSFSSPTNRPANSLKCFKILQRSIFFPQTISPVCPSSFQWVIFFPKQKENGKKHISKVFLIKKNSTKSLNNMSLSSFYDELFHILLKS